MSPSNRPSYSEKRKYWTLQAMQTSALTLVFFAVILLPGCTRTVVGGYVDSSDKKYRVYGRIYGEYGRSFLDETDKKIRISIVADGGSETLLFRREYRVHGSSVGWDATWHDHTNLTMVVFQYPPGVNRWDTSKNGVPTNHILTVTYFLDSKTGTFAEQLAK